MAEGLGFALASGISGINGFEGLAFREFESSLCRGSLLWSGRGFNGVACGLWSRSLSADGSGSFCCGGRDRNGMFCGAWGSSLFGGGGDSCELDCDGVSCGVRRSSLSPGFCSLLRSDKKDDQS